MSNEIDKNIIYLFRLYTGSKTSALADAILNSIVYKDVLENNVNIDESYNDMPTISMEKTLTTPNTALYYVELPNSYKCKVVKYNKSLCLVNG